MLKTATIFKDFKITANADNTAVTFIKVNPLSISVKNDNFAEQVQILDNAGIADLFYYKYITFDDSAVFEIKDCIKNGKYTTLFIQYLSNITFASEDSNFRVDGVSVSKLQRLGFDINQFAEILGHSLKINYVNYNSEDITGQEYFTYGVKLRFSEMPQNLNVRLNGTGGVVEVSQTQKLNYGNTVFNPSLQNIDMYPNSTSLKYTAIDNAVSIIIPMPLKYALFLEFNATGTVSQMSTISGFLATLSSLITDLTLSVEMCILSNKSIAVIDDSAIKNMIFSYTTGATSLTLPVLTDENLQKLLHFIRTPSELVIDTVPEGSPCFIINATEELIESNYKSYGFIEVLDFIKIKLPDIAVNQSYINATILDNTIDISKVEYNYFYLKRESGFIRVYIDIEKNIYTDIVTTLEFAKNAYSNFDAYKKANVELVNSQTNATLQQQQQQKRGMQNLDHVISGANSLQSAAFSLGMGSVGGAVGALVGGAVSIAANEAKFNMQQQNDKANTKLATSQALETAQYTITPSSDLKGSVSLITVLKAAKGTTVNFITPIVLSKIELTQMQLYNVQKYIFDNALTEKITSITQIKKPQWQTLFNYYQVKIKNRSAINTRKDLIIFVED